MMAPAVRLALTASGAFLLLGLATGVWKYRRIMRSPDHRAPVYVDIAHRAALLYSFAALVMMKLVEYSPYSSAVQMWATSVPLLFFVLAVLSYVYHGALEDTENQLAERSFLTTWGMALLIAGEIGGVLVLFWGFVSTQVL
jgi:succinate dehydrogenase hydrophobic anchor subunit